MAKRRRTTGVPKVEQAKDTDTQSKKSAVRRGYKSRAEREASIQRWVVWGTGATIVVLSVILVIAFAFDQFINPNRVVASVDDFEISLDDYQERVRLERALINFQFNAAFTNALRLGIDTNQLVAQEPFRTWLDEMQIPEQLGNRLLNDMINEKIMREEAAVFGIEIGEDDVQEQINQFFGFDPEALEAVAAEEAEATATALPSATPEPETDAEATDSDEPTPFPTSAAILDTPVPTPSSEEQLELFERAVASFYVQVRDQTDLSDAHIDAHFERLALRNALREEVTADVSNLAPFVNARHILVADEETANDLIGAIQAGESFAELARANSTDTGSGALGGELGWAQPSNYVPAFADALSDAEVGALLGPVQSEFGYHVIQVRGREEREVSDAQFQSERNEAFAEWIDGLRDANADRITTSNIWLTNTPNDPPFAIDAAAAGGQGG